MSNRIKQMMLLAGASMEMQTTDKNTMIANAHAEKFDDQSDKGKIVTDTSNRDCDINLPTNDLVDKYQEPLIEFVSETEGRLEEIDFIDDSFTDQVPLDINPRFLSCYSEGLRSQAVDPKYVFSPINSEESDVDLSDSDPTYNGQGDVSHHSRHKVAPHLSSSTSSASSSSSSSSSSSDSDSSLSENFLDDSPDTTKKRECTPVSLWVIVRHGTRHPSGSDTRGMQRAALLKDTIVRHYHEGLGEMCAQDITDLSDWKWDDSLNDTQNYLTSEGYKELLHLGQRVREKFAPLLDDLDSFQFRPTNEQRTKESAKAFVEGLNNSRFTIEAALEQDNIIRPYKHCDRYNEEDENNTFLDNELKKLYESETFNQMMRNVRQRTGISTICRDDVKALNNLCRFYRAYSGRRRDPWCSLFNNEDQRVMEYLKDLTDYYRSGFGSSTAAKLGALPLKNLLENLEASVNGSRRVTGYFSHDTMVSMIFTALGLFRDYPGLSGLEIDPGRKWRTSFTTPFAANMIVVLNKCVTDNTYTHKVQLFVNEKMVPLCGERACTWEEFREKLLPFKDSKTVFCTV